MQSDEHYVNLIVNYLKNNSDDVLNNFCKEKLPEVNSFTECPSQPIHVYVSYVQLTHPRAHTLIWLYNNI